MIQFLLVFSDWGILFLRIALGVLILYVSLKALGLLKEKPFLVLPSIFGLVSFASLILGLFTQIGAALAGFCLFIFSLNKRTRGELLIDWRIILMSIALVIALFFLGGGSIGADAFFQIRIY